MIDSEKTKKVLFVWSDEPKEPNYCFQCKKEFTRLNYEVEVFNFRKYQFHRFNITNRILNKLLIKKINSFRPDIVLVIKGDSILPGVLKKINRDNMTVVNWCLDEPFGKFGRFNKVQNISEYDYFFIFDKYYSEQLIKQGINSYYLPGWGDPDMFKEIIPPDKRKYMCDLSFIGSHHPNREEIFTQISNYDIKIWGYRWKDIDKKSPLYPKIQKEVINSKDSIKDTQKMCRYFNSSKINLNVHHPQAINGGVNFRIFEVLLTNSFLLSDYNPGIEKLLKLNKEIVCFHNTKELRELIDYYLDNEEERLKIAKAGQKRVHKEHTTEHRIKEMLNIIKN